MKVLLTGCKGQVGWELEIVLREAVAVVATDRNALDIGDSSMIRRVIRDMKPDVIVNAAGYTAVDRAETEPEIAMQINGIAPGVMAEEVRELGALLVHYSTDYVFDGRKRSPYTEEDEASALSAYGRSKLEGEERIRASGCRHLILRTSWVYGPRASNFYRIIERKALAGDSMRMVDDQTSVPTSARFLASNTLRLLRAGATGLVHLVPSGRASRYEFAVEVARMLQSRSVIEHAKTADFPSAAVRPAFSVLDNRRAQHLLGAPLPTWQSALSDMRQSL